MADPFDNRRLLRDDALTARYRSTFDLDRLHVRAVHDTWGIADGLEATLSTGGTVVEITPGVGYDTDGSPIRLTRTVTVAPHQTGRFDLVATEDGVTAVRSPRKTWCAGSLVVASATAEARSSSALAWTDLELPTRWTRRRESAYVFAGSQTFTNTTFWERLVVSTRRARFPSTPLYFCRLDGPSPDVATYTPLGVRGVPARNRYIPRATPIHGPFFTICGATATGFTVLFTREVAYAYPLLTVHWVGVIPRSQILDVDDPCQTYPVRIN
ncbi:hypothetical protein ACFQW6_03620 [Nocardioides sp. GCM10028917]|uniref:hypothetical protein n=1 Tax=Nocardioides sp. GCM10028917 TaxID=3273408 RepID=UPI00360C4F61